MHVPTLYALYAVVVTTESFKSNSAYYDHWNMHPDARIYDFYVCVIKITVKIHQKEKKTAQRRAGGWSLRTYSTARPESDYFFSTKVDYKSYTSQLLQEIVYYTYYYYYYYYYYYFIILFVYFERSFGILWRLRRLFGILRRLGIRLVDAMLFTFVPNRWDCWRDFLHQKVSPRVSPRVSDRIICMTPSETLSETGFFMRDTSEIAETNWFTSSVYSNKFGWLQYLFGWLFGILGRLRKLVCILVAYSGDSVYSFVILENFIPGWSYSLKWGVP